MQIEIHGTGRAAGALAVAAARAGHTITSVRGRTSHAVEALEDLVTVVPGAADLRIIAVADDAVPAVARALFEEPFIPTVHVSGALPVAALYPLEGPRVGSFHPLQALPDARTGADRLAGSWIAVTAPEPFASTLDEFAESMGGRPFRLADADKAVYHAAAVAAGNFTVAALGIAEQLLTEAGVPFEAAAPLVAGIVANAFELGPRAALTGPIARGDTGTVSRQIEAIADVSDELLEMFLAMARATALYAGAGEGMHEVLR
jgi:predicted short-subunit dehydrogenase-like oxidoreductase (DUF2520 family)